MSRVAQIQFFTCSSYVRVKFCCRSLPVRRLIITRTWIKMAIVAPQGNIYCFMCCDKQMFMIFKCCSLKAELIIHDLPAYTN